MSRLYEREIKDFFEVAKIKMAGTTKEAKGKFGKSCDRTACWNTDRKTCLSSCYNVGFDLICHMFLSLSHFLVMQK